MNMELIESNLGGKLTEAVDARQLHGFLGSRKKFADWVKIKIIENPFFEQGVDFIIFPQSGKNPRDGRPRKDYAITIDTAKKVSMAEQTEAGNTARDYFLECERKAKGNTSALPQTFAEALRLAADLEEQKTALEEQAAKDAPHVEFSKSITESTGAIEIGEFAKVLKNADVKIGRNRLFEWLRGNGYIMKNNVPYQQYIENGYFAVKEGVWESKNGPRPYVKTLITGRGQQHLTKKLTAES